MTVVPGVWRYAASAVGPSAIVWSAYFQQEELRCLNGSKSFDTTDGGCIHHPHVTKLARCLLREVIVACA